MVAEERAAWNGLSCTFFTTFLRIHPELPSPSRARLMLSNVAYVDVNVKEFSGSLSYQRSKQACLLALALNGSLATAATACPPLASG